ncbi:thioredoxin domain-containing protein [bacterium]|nr:thioredoxin domain-containing protein [bacterium]
MEKSKRIILTILSLIGLALAIELCVVYYNANFAVDAKPSICAINEMMDCDGVARTSYSQFFGVPLSLWGVLLYLFFLFMTYVDKLQDKKFMGILKVFKNPASYIFCIGLFSFIISMILGCISILKINAVCIFCFMTYFVNLLIAITAKTKGISITDEVKISITDFFDALKDKKNVFWLVLVLLMFASMLAYTTVSNIFSPQIKKMQELKSKIGSYREIVDGNSIGPKSADVIINEYMDFNCGGCLFTHMYLHRIVDEFKNVRVIQHQLPLEKACNHNMQDEGHKNSCIKSKYALAAAKQNLYWEMADLLFYDGPDNEKEIIESARLLDFDIKKLKEDAYSEEVAQELSASIDDADSKSINGTPTIYIGIKKQMGVGSYFDFKQTIIDNGGIEKEQNE